MSIERTSWIVRRLLGTAVLVLSATTLSGCATAVRVVTWPSDPMSMIYVVDLDRGCTLVLGDDLYRSFGEPHLIYSDTGDDGIMLTVACEPSEKDSLSAGVRFFPKELGPTTAAALKEGTSRLFKLEPLSNTATSNRAFYFSGRTTRLDYGAGIYCQVRFIMNQGVGGAYLGPERRVFVFTGEVDRSCSGWLGQDGGWRGFFSVP